MTKRAALVKLKKFWTENGGSDYLQTLLQIKKELPKGHKSAKSLEEEIKAIEAVYPEFLLWKTPKRKTKAK